MNILKKYILNIIVLNIFIVFCIRVVPNALNLIPGIILGVLTGLAIIDAIIKIQKEKRYEKLTFNNFVDLMQTIPAPEHEFGIFNLHLITKETAYTFYHIKFSFSNNPDVFGFGLNHYCDINMPRKQRLNKQGEFFDTEDIDIAIERENFVEAVKVEDENTVILHTKNWVASINWQNIL